MNITKKDENAQPARWNKGIKEGQLEFTTPVPYTHTLIHTKVRKCAHNRTHRQTQKQQHGLAT